MRLLIVGEHAREVVEASRIAAGRGAEVRQVATVEQALHDLRNGRGADLLLVEVRLDVRRIIDRLLRERIWVPVVVYGVDADPRAAVAAIRAGAREFIPLPPDSELIAAVLEAVADSSRDLVVEDPVMLETLRLARRYAPADASVLITGESGTGKEVLARFLHANSRRSGGPFISVNCAAIPENLLESELFGHEKGAFTGAVARRIGKFEEASGGTLLLDEISEMDIRLQAKLLRAIQEREIDRVGGGSPVRVDIRVIATSNRDLERAVVEGRFREDLYYRLNVLCLRLPPLRERPADIVALAHHFARKHAAANGLPERPLTADALARLRAHPWRGNVRELENCIHRAVLLAQGEVIDAAAIDLRTPPAGGGEGAAPAAPVVGRTVAEMERDLILQTLQHTLGNRTQAANILGISIRTLRNKLRQYSEAGLPVPPAAHA